MGAEKISRLEIFRNHLGFAQLRPFHILLDGKDVCEVKEGETVNVPISPEVHSLQVRIGFKRSKPLRIFAERGQKIYVEIRKKDFPKVYNLISMLVVAILVAIGAILFTGIGAGLGLSVGLLARSYIFNMPQLYSMRSKGMPV